MTMKKVWLITAATFLGFLLLAVLLDVFLPLAGRDRVLLWVGMVLLGTVAAVLVYLQLAPKKKDRKRGRTDVELLLDAASKRLAVSRIAGGRISRLPVALVLGPTGSAKTSTVLEAGLGSELLAGETSAAGAVAPTAGINVWYAREGVIVEAAGTLPDDRERWEKLLRRLRPGRLAAAFGRGRQAPRVAVVCVSCDLFVTAGATTLVPAAAARLRQALAEVSQKLGVRLPVYVVFTKTDRIPHFEEFVRGLSREEAQEILGATLPLAEVTPGGYADFQAQRLRDAFGGIFRSLAAWRLPLLPREAREIDRTGAYEFPREIRKITDLASGFLAELCRPSQLGVNPFLRGFYFTGVRPVVVNDTPAAPQADGQQRISLGATGVFGIPSMAPTPQPAAPRPGARRVPEWVFLRRLFPDVVLVDERAQALTAGGTRVDLLRRGMLATAAALLLVLATGFTISYGGNRRLLAEGRAALESVRPLVAPVGEAPSAASLLLLDSLRATVDGLSDHQRGRPPLRLRWGLYSGDDARVPLRQVYFDRFAALLWNGVRTDLVAGLQSLPEEPQQTEDYAVTYGALKAYLVTTSHPGESRADFLTPALLRAWRYGDALDPERRQLTSGHFDFFARELPLGNPFPAEPVESVVVQARTFLGKFTGIEPFYRALLAEAAATGEGIRFAQLHPGSAGIVQNDYVVPPEFTESGWARVESILSDLDALLAREDWVLGERAAIAPGDRARMAVELRSRYVTGYAAAWRAFLEAGSVAGFSGPEDAARKLEQLSGNQSPLLQMLALAAQHTAVDSSVMRQTFAPLYAVIPPGQAESLVNEGNAGYMNDLLALHAAMVQVAEARGPARTDALSQAQAGVQKLDLQVSQLAQAFPTQGEALQVGNQVERLLAAPIASARGLVRGLPTAEVNAAGASFCTPFRALDSRYPFNDGATQQVSIEELGAALQKGSSQLWTFYDEQLQALLVPQGSRYAARVGADPAPNPAFVAFFNRAAAISDGFFPEGAESPIVRFALNVATSAQLPEVRVTIDGQTQTYTPTNTGLRTFTWDGARARTFRVTRVVDGVEETLLEGDEGPWTLVRMLRLAQWEQTGPSQYRLRWQIAGDPGELVAALTFAARTPVFAPGALRLDCVSQIVR